MLAAAGHRGGVFNVGTGIETSVNRLYSVMQDITGTDAEPEYAPARLGDLLRSTVDVTRAERELGWRPQRTLEAGLAETWAWTAAPKPS
jgi:UDP-glucose 4-epimerase